jgi:hypothetical protein
VFAKFFDHQGYGGGDGRLAIPRAELERKQVALNAREKGESESPPNSTLGREGKGRQKGKGRREENKENLPPSQLSSLASLLSLSPVFPRSQYHTTSQRSGFKAKPHRRSQQLPP